MKLKKILVFFLLSSLILITRGDVFLKPKPVQAAFPAESETSEFVYKFAKGTAWTMFKMMFFQMINSGRLYILTGKSDIPIIPPDLGRYAEDVAIELARQGIENSIGLDICNPEMGVALKASLAGAQIPSYQRTVIPPCTARETWRKVLKGESLALDDFVKISEPQNNFFGAYLLASSELETKKTEKIGNIKWEYSSNLGFLTPKKEKQVPSEKKDDKPGAKETKEEITATPQETKATIEQVTSTESEISELKQLGDSKTWDDGLGHVPGALQEALVNILQEKALMMLTQEIYKITK